MATSSTRAKAGEKSAPKDEATKEAADAVEASDAHPTTGDRVAMLSMRADGVPDQHSPVLVGDKEDIRAATETQLAQQAVSAVDEAERPGLGLGGEEPAEDVPDASIAELAGKQEDAAKAATSQADELVDRLHEG